VVVLFGFGSTCIQRWSLEDRTMRWSQASEVASSFFDPTFAADGIDLVMSDSSVLVHVSLSEGTTTALALPQDASPSPVLALAGGRLVTAVQSNRGTTRWMLLALDLRSKEVLWERELPDGAEPFDLSPDRSSDTVFEGETRFLVTARGDDEVAVVTMASPGARVTVETVDAATGRGTAAGRDTFALRSSTSTSPSVRVEAITGGRLVFSSESIPQVLDLATGKVVSSWAG
jgi:outer membrane protein assembly factor BamB